MQIFSDPDRDVSTRKTEPGSYEWWYFDAMSADGTYGFVVIFYQGNPFSRRYIDALQNGSEDTAAYYPAVSISLYKEGKPIFYSFEEVVAEQAGFSGDNPEGFVGKNRFYRDNTETDELVYKLELDQEVPCGDHLKADIIFRSRQNGSIFKGLNAEMAESSDQPGHSWNLVQPRATIVGTLELTGYTRKSIRFEGTGYHDHNTGMEPMKESFREWYWGRFHFSDYTLVYYLMNEEEGLKNRAWLIDSDHTSTELIGNCELSDIGLNVFGLKSARKIEMNTGDNSFLIQQETTLDDGPFYQRFRSRLVLSLDDKIYQAEGISEYICPSRIYGRVFRPLVNMRIQYPDKKHWVQKSPRLYRWTW